MLIRRSKWQLSSQRERFWEGEGGWGWDPGPWAWGRTPLPRSACRTSRTRQAQMKCMDRARTWVSSPLASFSSVTRNCSYRGKDVGWRSKQVVCAGAAGAWERAGMAGRRGDLVECVSPVCQIRLCAQVLCTPVAFTKQHQEHKQKLDEFEQTSREVSSSILSDPVSQL